MDLSGAITEHTGKVSASRVMSFLAFGVIAYGMIYIMLKTHVFKIPDGSTEFIGVSYAINRLSAVVGQFSGSQNQTGTK